MNTFNEIKQKYSECRDLQRKLIINHLKNKGFEVLNEKGGKGKTNYTSSNKLEIPYDLSNWKWIDVKKENINYLISLQAFDKDYNTGNYHVLMDRLGVYTYEKYDAEKAFQNMVTLEIDLPIDDEKLNKLVLFLEHRLALHKLHRAGQEDEIE